ncbi:MAG: sigma-70 family RNA polymerase sigma factor [Bacteroidota bacterium]
MPEKLLPNLFRTEYGKMVAVLLRTFGLDEVETAEDLVSETFLLAAETWGKKGLPQQPQAWLYGVAKNKAKDYLRRQQLYQQKIRPQWQRKQPLHQSPDLDFSPIGFQDSQLRLLFSLCHPSLSPDTQVCLSLRLLCGFGIGEIAQAFLTNKATIHKRIARGKTRLREQLTKLELPAEQQLSERLDSVLTTLYLLFNEGYYSSVSSEGFRENLCADAIRLTLLLTTYSPTEKPKVYALLALMCFQSSRFKARINPSGDFITYADQDRSLWDKRLILQGRHFMGKATADGQLSRYQLEAAIALLHTETDESAQKWPHILALYNRLLQLQYSPVAALNRTYAYSRVHGPKKALVEALKIQLAGNVNYHLLLGELYQQTANTTEAIVHWQQAIALTKDPAGQRMIQQKFQQND